MFQEDVSPGREAAPVHALGDLGLRARLRRTAAAFLLTRRQQPEAADVLMLLQRLGDFVQPAGHEAQIVLHAHQQLAVREIEGAVHAAMRAAMPWVEAEAGDPSLEALAGEVGGHVLPALARHDDDLTVVREGPAQIAHGVA